MQSQWKLFAAMFNLSVRNNAWKVSDLLSLALATALLLTFLVHSRYSLGDLGLAASVSAGFALGAWLLKGVNAGGALTGGIVAFIFLVSGGWRLFLLLLFVFCVTYLATKVASAKTEKYNHPRSASQVMANLLVPTLLLVLSVWFRLMQGWHILIVLATLAELGADTISSEMGDAYGHPTYLITSGKVMPVGINGGVSAVGTQAGVLAAISIAGLASALALLSSFLWIAALAGIAGMFVDSVLGATLENRGWLNNGAVNLLSSASSAAIAWALIRFILI